MGHKPPDNSLSRNIKNTLDILEQMLILKDIESVEIKQFLL